MTVLEGVNVISKKTLYSMLTQLDFPILSLPSSLCCQEFQMMTDGQVAILDHAVTLKMEPCYGAEELYTDLGLPTSGIIF